jgi:hypothetical protein
MYILPYPKERRLSYRGHYSLYTVLRNELRMCLDCLK